MLGEGGLGDLQGGGQVAAELAEVGREQFTPLFLLNKLLLLGSIIKPPKDSLQNWGAQLLSPLQ